MPCWTLSNRHSNWEEHSFFVLQFQLMALLSSPWLRPKSVEACYAMNGATFDGRNADEGTLPETAHAYRGPNRSNAALKIGKAAAEHRLPASDASQHLTADGAGTPDILGRRNRHST